MFVVLYVAQFDTAIQTHHAITELCEAGNLSIKVKLVSKYAIQAQNGVHILVGTPNEMIDMAIKSIDTEHVREVYMDDAEAYAPCKKVSQFIGTLKVECCRLIFLVRMVNPGTLDQVCRRPRAKFSLLPKNRIFNTNISQHMVMEECSSTESKCAVLKYIINEIPTGQIVIFCNVSR